MLFLGVDTSTGSLPSSQILLPGRTYEERPTQTTSRPVEVISIWVGIGDLCRIAGNESLWQAVGLSLSLGIVWEEECNVWLVMGRTRDSEYVLETSLFGELTLDLKLPE